MEEFNLIKIINEKTCDKFKFLRLKQVFFDEKKNLCQISLIYPSDKEIKDEEKDEIIKIIKDTLKLDNALYVIKINKNFVETDLIKDAILLFLQKKCPVFYSGIIEGCYSGGEGENGKNLKIEILEKVLDDFFCYVPNVKISFLCEESLKNYFYNFKIDKNLTSFLRKNFCAEFLIDVMVANLTTNVQEDFLEKKIEEIKAKSDINAILDSTQNKFIVENRKAILGEVINFNPRFIRTIVEPQENCVVAGKINFFQEKSYKSKRTKKNKDGTEEQIIKPYFSFSVKDETANINIVVFPTKAGYHKMHLLKDGDTVLVQGKIERYNGKFEMMGKRISLCDIPSKHEIIKDVDSSKITNYRFVKPIKYVSTKQSNLFESQIDYSREVQNQNFVVYDFETTGIDPNKEEIIEIGALKIEKGVFTQVFTTLVKPKKLIPLEATKINRITNEMVANCYSIEQVIQDFYLFCKDCQMVGYNNIGFDSLFLIQAGKQIGIDFNNTQVDAFLLAKQKLKGLHNYKLGTVSKYLEVNLVDAHRALNDVLATAEVFLKLY